MSIATVGILPNPGFGKPIGIYPIDPNANRGAQADFDGLTFRYFYEIATATSLPAVEYFLPNDCLFDFDVRWLARLISGTGVHGSGRTLFSAIAHGGVATITTGAILMAPSPGPGLTIVLPGSANQVDINVQGQSGSGDWQFQIDVDIVGC